MASSWECPCGKRNSGDRDACVDCERARPEKTTRSRQTEKAPLACRVDGGTVDDKGFCSVAQAYVSTATCPFACPYCRQPLTWSGNCFACFGCSTGKRADWTIPGDRYETSGGHYKLVEKGPRRLCTPAQNHEALKVVMGVAAGELTEAAGHEMLATLGIVA